ncbi:type II toxin-antitoxin system VapC family toxin [Rhodopseudomonas palustris]|nr:type II toxin-antitoxin system VapC family toxin [Rhodopseudomonas palustris]
MQPSSSAVVLDSSAILAVLLRERGEDIVRALKGLLLVSAVNFAEVRSKLFDRGYLREAVDRAVGPLPLKVVDFNVEQARLASDLRPKTSQRGLSLGDRACLALAIATGAVVYTADRAWTEIELPVEVRAIR